VIGIAVIIISQTVKFTKTTCENIGIEGFRFANVEENTTLKNIVLFAGIALFVWGGIMFAQGLNKNSDNK